MATNTESGRPELDQNLVTWSASMLTYLFFQVRLRDLRTAEAENMIIPEGKLDPRVSDAWTQAGSPPEAK